MFWQAPEKNLSFQRVERLQQHAWEPDTCHLVTSKKRLYSVLISMSQCTQINQVKCIVLCVTQFPAACRGSLAHLTGRHGQAEKAASKFLKIMRLHWSLKAEPAAENKRSKRFNAGIMNFICTYLNSDISELLFGFFKMHWAKEFCANEDIWSSNSPSRIRFLHQFWTAFWLISHYENLSTLWPFCEVPSNSIFCTRPELSLNRSFMDG